MIATGTRVEAVKKKKKRKKKWSDLDSTLQAEPI